MPTSLAHEKKWEHEICSLTGHFRHRTSVGRVIEQEYTHEITGGTCASTYMEDREVLDGKKKRNLAG